MFIETTTMSDLKKACKKSRVIPVVTLEDADKAVALAHALVAGGIGVIEITLRTASALESITNIKSSGCAIAIGAGTLLDSKQVYKAKKAGADFGVSPGTTSSLLDAAYDCMLPILPGVSTPSEIMGWKPYGVDFFKFFPAEPAGGCKYISSLSAPFPDVVFCPTGGITAERAGVYLKQSNVLCVGGSWITPQEAISKNNFERITQLAKEASEL